MEKTVAQNLERLQILEQGKRSAKDYAARFCVLMQRVPVAQHPAQEVMNDYFLKGLSKDLWTALATVDKVNTPLADVIAQAILAGELLDNGGAVTKKKAHRHSSRQRRHSDSSSDSDTRSFDTYSSDSGSADSAAAEPEKETKKTQKSGKVSMTSTSDSSSSKSLKEVWCSKCRNSGHPTLDCVMNEKWCAICTTTTHNTTDCYYNGRGSKARGCTQNKESKEGQPMMAAWVQPSGNSDQSM